MARPQIIGHRGACGHAAENTLTSAALAHAQGADLIELDVILSRDGELVVCHDLHLDEITDVSENLPGHARADGLTYVADLTWPQLQRLRVRPRATPPLRSFTPQPLATLDQHLAQLAALNHATGRTVELYLELKSPAWYHAAGQDLAAATLACLTRHGLTHAASPVIVETFDPAELRRLRSVFKTSLRLAQLIGENAWGEAACDYDAMVTPAGLAEIAATAQAIAVNLDRVLRSGSTLVRDAHAAGLPVHAYTFKADALPTGFPSSESALDHLFTQLHLDGLFTDHPDTIAAYLRP